MPAISEPTTIPSLALLSIATDAASPVNDRLAMKSDTVNPIPPSSDTPAIIFQSVPAGIEAILSLTHSQENENMPKNLPTTKLIMIVKLTPWNIDAISKSPKKMPALAKANSGTMM